MKKKNQKVWIILFLSPSLFGLLIFVAFPILASLGLTFFEWDMLTPPNFVWFSNFTRLFADENFWLSLKHTLGFILGYIPLVIITSLSAALLLDQKLIGRKFLRTAFFIPVVSAWVAVALLWMWIFNPKFGLLNFLLSLIGIVGPAWLYDPAWAMPAIILTSVWKDTGFFMVMFMAGLQNIPEIYYEASKIDGANRLDRFFRITLPLLSPVTFFVTIMALINSFQVFDQVWIMTKGGPAGATSVVVEQIVKNAFSYSRMGYASTISWALFIMVFSATLIQMWAQKRWVNY
ncbi:MAG: sugar ABC transporter permease [Bacteroidetes bacterium]|jgi:multiple sugar transport system permease protein|nr:sugar ABC transporter permease [Bacteroidota bacterium]MBT6988443.1 sugar ABC transporter permease [Chloroflexota bacterium]